LLASGHVDKSVGLLQTLVERYPDALEPQLNLAVAITESGAVAEAESLYRNLLVNWSEHPAVLLNAARFNRDYADRKLARNLVEQLLRIDPQSRAAKLLFADLCRHDGLLNQARETWQMLLARDPSDQEAYLPLIFTALNQQNWDVAASLLKDAFARCNGQSFTRLLAAWFDLPSSVKQTFFLQWSSDAFAWVQQNQLFDVDDSFLKQLIFWLKSEPSLITDRPGKPTVGGMQSHELFNRHDDPLSLRLSEKLTPHISAYQQQLSNTTAHVASPSSGSTMRLSGWGVVLRQGGKQIRHTHPESDISGVLYLACPSAESEDLSDQEGALWFSPNPDVQDKEIGIYVTPKPGLLVLFPSFLPHETIPFVSKEDRICIAFNAKSMNYA